MNGILPKEPRPTLNYGPRPILKYGGRPLTEIAAPELVDIMLRHHGENLPGSDYIVKELRDELLGRFRSMRQQLTDARLPVQWEL